jgi:hypothetical protein
MALPMNMLTDPNVGQFSSFGRRYTRDRYGNYMDANRRTPLQNWRAMYRQRYGRWPSPREEQDWTVNNIPGSRYGLASQSDPYGRQGLAPRPIPAPAPPMQPGFADPGPVAGGAFRRFGAELPPGLIQAMQNIRGQRPQATVPPPAATPSRLPDFWGIVNNAASYDRGQPPVRPLRFGAVE